MARCVYCYVQEVISYKYTYQKTIRLLKLINYLNIKPLTNISSFFAFMTIIITVLQTFTSLNNRIHD